MGAYLRDGAIDNLRFYVCFTRQSKCTRQFGLSLGLRSEVRGGESICYLKKTKRKTVVGGVRAT